MINTSIYDELSTDINIPGVFIAEKDAAGHILQTQLYLHNTAARSGLNISFQVPFEKIESKVKMIQDIPLNLYVNGLSHAPVPINSDVLANANSGIVMLPHCFISQEIYLQ